MCVLLMLKLGAHTVMVVEILWNERVVVGEWASCAVVVSSGTDAR